MANFKICKHSLQLDPLGTLGCCPAQCETEKDNLKCTPNEKKGSNLWLDPGSTSFEKQVTGTEKFNVFSKDAENKEAKAAVDCSQKELIFGAGKFGQLAGTPDKSAEKSAVDQTSFKQNLRSHIVAQKQKALLA